MKLVGSNSLDGPVNVVHWHVVAACLVHCQAEPKIHVGIAAAAERVEELSLIAIESDAVLIFNVFGF